MKRVRRGVQAVAFSRCLRTAPGIKANRTITASSTGAATVNTAAPTPGLAPFRSPASATRVGPRPTPSDTFKKNVTDVASPRSRFGTWSRIAAMPQDVVPSEKTR